MPGQYGTDADGLTMTEQNSATRILAFILGALQASAGGASGDATATNQATQITAEQAIQASLAHGQAIMAGSVPVAIASDQGAIPVTQSGTQNANIVGVGGVIGQQPSAASASVVLASDQSAINVSPNTNAWPVQGVKLASNANSPTRFMNVAANATLNVKSSTGNVFSAYCINSNAAARYFQLHNTATVPTSTVTVPVLSFLVPPASQIIIGADFFTNEGLNFATGIAFAFSTTRDVYTAGAAGDQQTAVNYI